MADSVFGIPTLQSLQTQQLQVPQINPTAIPNNAFEFTGALGGAVGGTQLANQQAEIDRNLRASDLDYANAMNTYQQNLADNPLRDQSRSLQAQAMGQTGQLLSSGLPLSAAKSSLQAQVQKNMTSMSADQLLDSYNHYQGMIPISRYVNETPDFLTNEGAQKHVSDLAKAANIDGVPKPGEWKQSDLDHVKKVGDLGLNTVNYLQNSGLMVQKYIQEMGTQKAAAGMGTLEYTKEMDRQTAMLQFLASANVRMGLQSNDEKVQREVHDTIASGQPLSESQVQALAQIKMKEAAASGQTRAAIADKETQLAKMNTPQLAQEATVWLGGKPSDYLNQADTNRPALLSKLNTAIENKLPVQRAMNEAAMSIAGAQIRHPDNSVTTFRADPMTGQMKEVPVSGPTKQQGTGATTVGQGGTDMVRVKTPNGIQVMSRAEALRRGAVDRSGQQQNAAPAAASVTPPAAAAPVTPPAAVPTPTPADVPSPMSNAPVTQAPQPTGAGPMNAQDFMANRNVAMAADQWDQSQQLGRVGAGNRGGSIRQTQQPIQVQIQAAQRLVGLDGPNVPPPLRLKIEEAKRFLMSLQ